MAAAEIERLKAEISHLRSLLRTGDLSIPAEWGLSRMEERLVACLYKRGEANNDQIIAACYYLHGLDEPESSGDVTKVRICHTRRKLTRAGFDQPVPNRWGRGYRLSDSVRAAIDAHQGRAQ